VNAQLVPNPFSKVNPKASASIGVDALLQRPDLALHVTSVISTWAFCDTYLAAMLCRFLKADAAWVVAQMLDAVTSSDARKAAITAAAKASLPDKDFAQYQRVMKEITPSRNTRNRFAHWLWGASPEMPDALILMDPTEYTRNLLTIAETIRRIRELEKDKPRQPRPDENYKPDPMSMVVYKRAELEREAEAARAAFDRIRNLDRYFYDGTPMNAPWRDELLHALLALRDRQEPSSKNTR
jgi:hypothetical protein